MNEAETRAELIDPKLTASGWGVVEGSKVLREFYITAGKIQTGGTRAKPMIADYLLVRIPAQSCHQFQTNAATHSILKLPLIPVNVATPWW